MTGEQSFSGSRCQIGGRLWVALQTAEMAVDEMIASMIQGLRLKISLKFDKITREPVIKSARALFTL